MIPTLYIKDKWYNEIVILKKKKYEYRIGTDFYINLNKKIIWLSSNKNKCLIFIKSINQYQLNNDILIYNNILNLYSKDKINKYGIVVMEIELLTY